MFFLNFFKIFLKYLFSRKKRYLNLFLLILKTKPKSILEIGVYRGIRSEEMISVAKIFNKKIYYYGFDLFELISKEIKKKELSKYPINKLEIKKKLLKLTKFVTLIKGYTKNTLKKFKKTNIKVDFIFIDGGHHINTIKIDWFYSLMLSKKKTIFIFDDYYIDNKLLIKNYGCNKLISSLDKKKFKIKILPFTDYYYLNKIKTGIKMVQVEKY